MTKKEILWWRNMHEENNFEDLGLDGVMEL
jgi:hypothetical protein